MSARDELAACAALFGQMPPCRFLGGGRVICMDSGVDASSENWAIARDGADVAAAADEAIAFFGHRPFTWPAFGPTRELEILLGKNFSPAGELIQMTADIMPKKTDRVRPAGRIGPDESREWARACWLGFDSDDEAPDAFVRLARAMSSHDDFFLCGARDEGGEIASTGALVLAGDAPWIFYVATVPSARRRGLGRNVIASLLGEAASRGARRVSLLSTEQGGPFYRSLGFDEQAAITIASHA